MATAIALAPMMSFVPNPTPSSTPPPTATQFKYYGSLPPTGYFDPLKIANDKNTKYLREAELQHGRIAMLATLLIPGFEMMNPEILGINYLSNMDLTFQLPFWYTFAAAEFYRMYTGWNSPFYGEERAPFSLSDDYQPGNLLAFKPEKVTERKYNTELSNGRLAMLATAHIIGSELVTGQTLAEQFANF
jgi:hypothetical protein